MTASPPDSKRAGGTNGWAIAAFVVGILGGTILSVIFAIVALVQIKVRHQRGLGLAIAALVISTAWIAAITAVIAYGISTQGKSVQAVDLNTGDCVKDAYEGGLPSARYLGMIAEAAQAAGAPDEYVEELRNRPCRSLGI